VNLTSSEWIRIRDAAGKLWPKECLSRAEIASPDTHCLVGIFEEPFAFRSGKIGASVPGIDGMAGLGAGRMLAA
jgi:hypothetical protein